MDTSVLKWSQGRKSLTTMLTGLPVFVLSTTGARSGKTRTTPVVGIPHGENIILVPSSFGSSTHPGWYYNMRAYPEVELISNGQTQAYIARIAGLEERQDFWQLAVSYYPGYQSYEERCGGREIPIFLLEPIQ